MQRATSTSHLKLQILLSENGMFRLATAMFPSAIESLLLLIENSSFQEQTIPVTDRNISIDDRNVALKYGNAHVCNRNVEVDNSNFGSVTNHTGKKIYRRYH
ncbi:MAG: hypothetical protein LBJ63_11525 [Prevotellaceae bacterium]|jgi:hypothetical protein|nr:hypothetical protein [Prevotellaceae bacterium]